MFFRGVNFRHHALCNRQRIRCPCNLISPTLLPPSTPTRQPPHLSATTNTSSKVVAVSWTPHRRPSPVLAFRARPSEAFPSRSSVLARSRLRLWDLLRHLCLFMFLFNPLSLTLQVCYFLAARGSEYKRNETFLNCLYIYIDYTN